MINSLAFSPDGKRLVSGGFDRTVRIWDPETGLNLLTLKGHSGRVWSVAFASDGKTLVSGGEDQIVKIWRAATEDNVQRLAKN